MIASRTARRLDFLRATETPRGRELNLVDVRWLDPLHLVGIAAEAQLAHRAGTRLRLVGVRADQANYAARMHLGRIVESFGGEHELPTVAERDQRDTLLEVRPLRDPADVEQLCSLVYNRVAATDPVAARALHVALAEVGDNVCQHARSIGFMAAQTIAEHGVLRFAVADAGVGLLATLTGLGAADDHQALELALSGRRQLSSPGHGYGLPRTVEMITRLNGELLLASGRAARKIEVGGRFDRTLDNPYRGTIFEGAVPAGPALTGPTRSQMRE
ncbi:MAG TPA: hypothetical protein VHO01_06770 [Jatrophihabitans sp.]|nr:hypothetical protein [Jatrophihabitans sp.]